MSDDESEVEELRDEVARLEGKIDDLEARYEAAMTKSSLVRDLLLGDRDAFENEVQERPSVWEQVEDLRSAVTSHGDRMDRLDSAGARGQPGAARKAKIRHALVRRAMRGGKVSISQATQQESPSLDYDDVLALFDYEIGDSYASKLLTKAAGGHPAFWIQEPTNARDGRKKLRVDVSELDEDSPYLREVRRNASSESANQEFAELGNNERESGGR